MLIHVKKNSFIALTLVLSLQAVLAEQGQAQKQGGGSGASSTPPVNINIASPDTDTPAPAAPSASGLDGATSSTLDYLFNHKAQQGTAAYAAEQGAKVFEDKIRAMDAFKTPGGLNDPVMRARFETYLSLEQVPQNRIDAYFAKVDEISTLLKAGGEDNVVKAYKDLYDLSSYEDLDAGISAELAHQIEGIWGVDRTNNDLEKKNTDLRHDVDVATHNSDLDAEDLKRQEMLDQQQKQTMANGSKRGGANNGGSSAGTTNAAPNSIPDPSDSLTAAAALAPTMGETLQGKMEMFDELEKNASARAKIFLNERRENMENDAVRTNFADYISTLYGTHRYYQVIMAAAFYQNFFPDGDVPQDLGNQVASAAGTHANVLANSGQLMGKKFLGMNTTAPLNAVNQFGGMFGGSDPQSNKPMTIPEMVTSALVINGQVSSSIKAFNYKESSGEIASAAEQLQEAFVGNEYHPALQGLPRDQKGKVGEFLDKISVLKSQLENRTFELVDDQIAQIKKIASDFDATEATAMSHTAQVQSMMLLGQATIAAQHGNEKVASDAMAEALEIWPTNPKLVSGAEAYISSKDVGNEMTAEFDRDVQEQNYRAIYEKALAFGPAVKDDPNRVQQLKDAVEKVKNAEAAAEKANYMVMNGDVDGAWETIELATKDWPDDMKLNKLLASLSERSADFVSALDKARNAEAKKEYGYSLTWYVNAQGYYPASQLANDGIDRLSKQILSPEADAAPSSAAPAPASTPAAEVN